MSIKRKIQIRRGAAADRPTLSSGEFGLDTDTGSEAVYIGTPAGNKELVLTENLPSAVTYVDVPMGATKTGTAAFSSATTYWVNPITGTYLTDSTNNKLQSLFAVNTGNVLRDLRGWLQTGANQTTGVATLYKVTSWSGSVPVFTTTGVAVTITTQVPASLTWYADSTNIETVSSSSNLYAISLVIATYIGAEITMGGIGLTNRITLA